MVTKNIRKTSIDRPGSILFFQHITSESLANNNKQTIKADSDRKVSTLSEYALNFILLCMIQKLCVK